MFEYEIYLTPSTDCVSVWDDFLVALMRSSLDPNIKDALIEKICPAIAKYQLGVSFPKIHNLVEGKHIISAEGYRIFFEGVLNNALKNLKRKLELEFWSKMYNPKNFSPQNEVEVEIVKDQVNSHLQLLSRLEHTLERRCGENKADFFNRLRFDIMRQHRRSTLSLVQLIEDDLAELASASTIEPTAQAPMVAAVLTRTDKKNKDNNGCAEKKYETISKIVRKECEFLKTIFTFSKENGETQQNGTFPQIALKIIFSGLILIAFLICLGIYNFDPTGSKSDSGWLLEEQRKEQGLTGDKVKATPEEPTEFDLQVTVEALSDTTAAKVAQYQKWGQELGLPEEFIPTAYDVARRTVEARNQSAAIRATIKASRAGSMTFSNEQLADLAKLINKIRMPNELFQELLRASREAADMLERDQKMLRVTPPGQTAE